MGSTFLVPLEGPDGHEEALLPAFQAELDELRGRVTVCETHGASIGELLASHAYLRDTRTLSERIEEVELRLVEASQKQSRAATELTELPAHYLNELSILKASVEEMGRSLREPTSRAEPSLLGARQGAMEQRLTRFESRLTGVADQTARCLEDMRAALASTAAGKEVLSSQHRELDRRVADMAEQLEDVRRALVSGAARSREEGEAAAAALQPHLQEHEEKLQQLQACFEGSKLRLQDREVVQEHEEKLQQLQACFEGSKLQRLQDREEVQELVGDCKAELSGRIQRLEELQAAAAAAAAAPSSPELRQGVQPSDLEELRASLQRSWVSEADALKARQLLLQDHMAGLTDKLREANAQHVKGMEAVRSALPMLSSDSKAAPSTELAARVTAVEERIRHLEIRPDEALEPVGAEASLPLTAGDEEEDRLNFIELEERLNYIEASLSERDQQHADMLARFSRQVEELWEASASQGRMASV